MNNDRKKFNMTIFANEDEKRQMVMEMATIILYICINRESS